jgi:hypothetical protein
METTTRDRAREVEKLRGYADECRRQAERIADAGYTKHAWLEEADRHKRRADQLAALIAAAEAESRRTR